MKTRFAPSPSGHLHVGGARTALFNFAYARQHHGTFILRIEDTDQKRSSDAASVGFLKDLAWLGVTWGEGPVFDEGGVRAGGGDRGPYFQSERLAIYNEAFDRLIASGHAYFAFDTPEELDVKRKAATAEKRAYRYDRAGLSVEAALVKQHLADGRPAVIRLRVPEGPVTIVDEVLGEVTIPAGEIDDFVLRKADGFPTYHFAVVVDDELMGVTHVLRAQEHFNNTAKHILIQNALGYRRPVYGHLPLITNPDGSKMSKRDKDKLLRATVREQKLSGPPEGTISRPVFDAWFADTNRQLDFDDAMRLAEALGVTLPEINVDDFRRSGYLPEVLVNFLALNGWSPGGDREKFDLDFICREFDLSRVLKTPAKFDRVKLLSFNSDAMRVLTREEFIARAAAHGRAYHPEFMTRLTAEQFTMLAGASHERSRTLDELFRGNRWVTLSDDAIAWEDAKPIRKALLGPSPNGLEQLAAITDVLAAIGGGPGEWSVPAIEASVTAFATAHAEGQMGRVAQPLRIAVTGGTVSPPIFDTLAILGRESSLARLARCREWGARLVP